MKFSCVISLLLLSTAAAFVPFGVEQPAFVSLRMSEESTSRGGALVPIKEETVEFTAGIIGGVAGLAIGGPVFAAIAAAASNYVSKRDNEVSDIIGAVSKSAIQIYNYLTTLDSKYEILLKAQSSLENSLEKLKSLESVDEETVAKVENALASTKDKITEINDEYDLLGGGVTALGVVGDLVEKAIVKTGELNEEYKLTDKAKDALSSAVSKAKSAVQEAS
mmetsp:Transcript_40163/g.45709  ORF Transcript_40163/g.45709 Transcript_40163/m.45709 type:complete len:221 (-) Transcript_40163:113-775(-)|eukprot:CAMPEP_0194146886 /NCGR_PEP_ID=MMETSP0152-20130528/22192_1 /TAXON_ID=1049557 /ORGANISM="Thalassiothrix antarctica, Strain L6-D1" /LENGTH=220 /DNA_ID=CAMNT_0038847535 /DNA_START=104 /DNA_END=769 /DNA_ORIENTATION=-